MLAGFSCSLQPWLTGCLVAESQEKFAVSEDSSEDDNPQDCDFRLPEKVSNKGARRAVKIDPSEEEEDVVFVNETKNRLAKIRRIGRLQRKGTPKLAK